MHASIEELIALNDARLREVPIEVQEHIERCPECQLHKDQLAYTANNAAQVLFEESDHAPTDAVWERLQASLPSRDGTDLSLDVVGSSDDVQTHINPAETAPASVLTLPSNQNQGLTHAIYALAASIAFVGMISVFMWSGNSHNQNQQTLLLQASVNQLMTNSRGLEQSLQQVVQQNQALSVANQQTADRLYWRLTYVDQLIQDANPGNSEQLKVLWNDRVEALNALNKLYFERDTTLPLSEI